jgi:hypothetical protein
MDVNLASTQACRHNHTDSHMKLSKVTTAYLGIVSQSSQQMQSLFSTSFRVPRHARARALAEISAKDALAARLPGSGTEASNKKGG